MAPEEEEAPPQPQPPPAAANDLTRTLTAGAARRAGGRVRGAGSSVRRRGAGSGWWRAPRPTARSARACELCNTCHLTGKANPETLEYTSTTQPTDRPNRTVSARCAPATGGTPFGNQWEHGSQLASHFSRRTIGSDPLCRQTIKRMSTCSVAYVRGTRVRRAGGGTVAR